MDYVTIIRLLVSLVLLAVLVQVVRVATIKHRRLMIEAQGFKQKFFSIPPDGLKSFLLWEFGELGGNRRRVAIVENSDGRIVLQGRARSVNRQVTEIAICGREPLVRQAMTVVAEYRL